VIVGIARLVLAARGTAAMRAGLVDDPHGDQIASALAARSRLARSPKVMVHPDARSPMLLGLARVTIVLPPVLAGPQRQMAIAHELAHYRRRDAAWSCLFRLVAAVFWYVPPVLWAAGAAEQAAEESCDAEAIASTHAQPPGVRRSAYVARHEPLVRRPDPTSVPLRGEFGKTASFGRLLSRTEASPVGPRVCVFSRPGCPDAHDRRQSHAHRRIRARHSGARRQIPGCLCPDRYLAGQRRPIDGSLPCSKNCE
jgi:hypothetical protein